MPAEPTGMYRVVCSQLLLRKLRQWAEQAAADALRQALHCLFVYR